MNSKESHSTNAMSVQTLRRLPNYYNYLLGLEKNDTQYVSAAAIAHELDLNEVQVRKDLAMASTEPGKPRRGFEVRQLMTSIENHLGYNNHKDAILVGAGMLGRALLAYDGFESHGVCIVAAFDKDPSLKNTDVGGKRILSVEELPQLVKEMDVQIGIIAVPAQNAQEACNLLVDNGVLAIWNFAPVYLKVPKKVKVRNENLATQLALLSHHLTGETQEG